MLCVNCSKEITRKVHPNTKRPFCNKDCYANWQKGKKFEDQGKKSRTKLTCSVENCGRVHFGRGYCRRHYITEHYNKLHGIKEREAKTAPSYTCIHCSTSFNAWRKNPKYCSSKCMGLNKRKDRIIKKGYAKVLKPEHHRADGKGYVFEHIVVAEIKIGRKITHPEEVHHVDHDPLNNSPCNLIVCRDHAEHMEYHR